MKIDLICSNCSKPFQKEKGEYNRRIKHGSSRFFCSSACAGNVVGGWDRINQKIKKNNSGYAIAKHAANQRDEYTPFRSHFRRIKRRHFDHDITLQDLKDQWDKQQGKCVYTGVNLITSNLDKKHSVSPIYLASLDRIDSNRGYIKGNIQWISAAMNYAKNTMTHEETLEFCKILKQSK